MKNPKLSRRNSSTSLLDEDENTDASKSEWSSVTGDESSFAVDESEEWEEEKSKTIW